MKTPCYPLITVDPFFSIWSPSQKLTDSDTILWNRITKRLTGTVTVDNKTWRFLGKGSETPLEQTSMEYTPLVMKYGFECSEFTLDCEFFTPLFTDDLYLLSLPCSYIRTKITFKDDKQHYCRTDISISTDMCYDRKKKPIEFEIVNKASIRYAKMGQKKQVPVYKSGDMVSADWGYTCIYADMVSFNDYGISASGENEETVFILAFDDVKSIDYMGIQYEGLWKEKHRDISKAIAFAAKESTDLFDKAYKENEKLLAPAKKYGQDYCDLLTVAYRQILAGHKLIRSNKGDLLYLSKECNSNGCINTVDVSYPALPFFLIYKPELVKAMMVGICDFARTDCWKYDFAPHDIGRYPLADGQVYGLYNRYKPIRKTLFRRKGNYYKDSQQMPVEECGNMLVMAYTYFLKSNDKDFLVKYIDLFAQWAEYLVSVGVVLENQLCTDDFAGHSEKNVNLAIKGVMGLACAGKICDALNIENTYASKAKQYADELKTYILPDGTLPFSVGQNDTWSLKYNMVWDKVLSFNLFDKELYKAECDLYKQKLNKYGTPLDYRKDFTKTDWLLWAAVLDESNELVSLYSKAILDFLADTDDIICLSDWIETKIPEHRGFTHRTVQSGLWFPILAETL